MVAVTKRNWRINYKEKLGGDTTINKRGTK